MSSRRLLAVLACVAASVSLAACSGDSEAKATASPTVTMTPSVATGTPTAEATIEATTTAVPPQRGGATSMPADLAAVLEALPVYPDRIVNEPGASQGGGRIGAAYWTKDAAPDVIAFYQRELPAAAWVTTASGSTTLSGKKDDGTQTSGFAQEFTKGAFRLRLVVAPTSKDPDQFQTQFGFVVDRAE